ncbi:MAG TPA: hypothetical protein VHJ82_05285 [Actinomycetota bacterium]|nr:hypothetical protein [Actinomycetota bacterium]
MNSRVRQLAVLSVIALLGTLFVVPSAAQAQNNLTIQVSNPMLVGPNCDPQTQKGCRTGESMRFLAPTLNVHKGDTLTFDFAGFHTASLLPVGQDWLAFRAANTGGVGKPFSAFIPDPDDTTADGGTAERPSIKPNPAVERPSIGGVPTDCGTEANPCTYDGGEVVNSGLPGGPPPVRFKVTIDANPGSGFWVMCFLHTHMVLRVNVVENAAAATTQAQIDAAKASMIAFDREWAESTDAQLINARSSHTTASGDRVFDVKAGVDSHWANLNGFYPKRTTVPKGSVVRFHWEQQIYEDHTVTMPRPAAFSLFDEFFVPMCDPDGDSGPGPDTPGNPDAQDPSQLCANPAQLEFDVTSRVFHGFGDGTFTGASDLEHSGIRGAQFSNAPFDVRFTARSDKKGWGFFCMLHPMAGRIIVKPVR